MRNLIDFFPRLREDAVTAAANLDLPQDYWREADPTVINVLTKYDAHTLESALQKLEDVLQTAKRFGAKDVWNRAFKLARNVDSALVRKQNEAYRPAASKTLAQTQQRSVNRVANKKLKPITNPEVGK